MEEKEEYESQEEEQRVSTHTRRDSESVKLELMNFFSTIDERRASEMVETAVRKGAKSVSQVRELWTRLGDDDELQSDFLEELVPLRVQGKREKRQKLREELERREMPVLLHELDTALWVSKLAYWERTSERFLQEATAFKQSHAPLIFETLMTGDANFPQKYIFTVVQFAHLQKTIAFCGFAGTHLENDWNTNVEVHVQHDPVLSAGAHSGFLSRAQQIPHLPLLRAANKVEATRFIFCGHSLGGAVSHLVTARVLRNMSSVPLDLAIDIISCGFGSPFIGDSSFKEQLEGGTKVAEHLITIVNDEDPVPRLLNLAATAQRLLKDSGAIAADTVNLLKALSSDVFGIVGTNEGGNLLSSSSSDSLPSRLGSASSKAADFIIARADVYCPVGTYLLLDKEGNIEHVNSWEDKDQRLAASLGPAKLLRSQIEMVRSQVDYNAVADHGCTSYQQALKHASEKAAERVRTEKMRLRQLEREGRVPQRELEQKLPSRLSAILPQAELAAETRDRKIGVAVEKKPSRSGPSFAFQPAAPPTVFERHLSLRSRAIAAEWRSIPVSLRPDVRAEKCHCEVSADMRTYTVIGSNLDFLDMTAFKLTVQDAEWSALVVEDEAPTMVTENGGQVLRIFEKLVPSYEEDATEDQRTKTKPEASSKLEFVSLVKSHGPPERSDRVYLKLLPEQFRSLDINETYQPVTFDKTFFIRAIKFAAVEKILLSNHVKPTPASDAVPEAAEALACNRDHVTIEELLHQFQEVILKAESATEYLKDFKDRPSYDRFCVAGLEAVVSPDDLDLSSIGEIHRGILITAAAWCAPKHAIYLETIARKALRFFGVATGALFSVALVGIVWLYPLLRDWHDYATEKYDHRASYYSGVQTLLQLIQNKIAAASQLTLSVSPTKNEDNLVDFLCRMEHADGDGIRVPATTPMEMRWSSEIRLTKSSQAEFRDRLNAIRIINQLRHRMNMRLVAVMGSQDAGKTTLISQITMSETLKLRTGTTGIGHTTKATVVPLSEGVALLDTPGTTSTTYRIAEVFQSSALVCSKLYIFMRKDLTDLEDDDMKRIFQIWDSATVPPKILMCCNRSLGYLHDASGKTVHTRNSVEKLREDMERRLKAEYKEKTKTNADPGTLNAEKLDEDLDRRTKGLKVVFVDLAKSREELDSVCGPGMIWMAKDICTEWLLPNIGEARSDRDLQERIDNIDFHRWKELDSLSIEQQMGNADNLDGDSKSDSQ
uniref:Fungal lipase-like domain-containing protein n=1 Tax=Pinguiococcus pyrenoidosus TaxID=172671 RepID=A0A7R9U281_9STRA|mmetsp:Transcript_12161/g.45128  ORF Transcript_12161/g.45128 Transcript_12161/m.45128 type:complete len:1229 (+) Transcript_12161:134-3820(+)|eukprot:scaffold4700_cov271-Pinguiococcus_pyrenoidosus.AAC.10